MSGIGHVAHLARRFAGSLSSAQPPAADDAWATSFMTEAEAELWHRLSNVRPPPCGGGGAAVRCATAGGES
jgi:hypothetical protein